MRGLSSSWPVGEMLATSVTLAVHEPSRSLMVVLSVKKFMGALFGLLVGWGITSVTEAGRPPLPYRVVSVVRCARLGLALRCALGRALFFAFWVRWHASFFGRRQLVIQGVMR